MSALAIGGVAYNEKYPPVPICSCGKQDSAGQCEHVRPLAGQRQTLPATALPMLDKLQEFQNVLMLAPQAEIPTEHVIHGGMYARTVRLAPDTIIAGALIKLATMVIVNGHAMVFVGDGWTEVDGYHVIPASAGRKQLFVALGPVEITMVFPTQAKTVEDAEREFTDEADQLLSRRQEHNAVNITGE